MKQELEQALGNNHDAIRIEVTPAVLAPPLKINQIAEKMHDVVCAVPGPITMSSTLVCADFVARVPVDQDTLLELRARSHAIHKIADVVWMEVLMHEET
jgi:hypothetical protein